MSGPRFDPTINLGHVITITCMAATVIGGYYSLSTRVDSVEKNVTEARHDIQSVSTIVVETARMDERMKAVERWVARAELR